MNEDAIARGIAALSRVLRKQYSFKPSAGGLLAWDVHRLIVLSRDLPVTEIELEDLFELDETYWYDGVTDRPTVRSIAEHMNLIEAADLAYPILLGEDSRVLDGMHRVAKAYLSGHRTIPARRFPVDPGPDHVGKRTDQLPY